MRLAWVMLTLTACGRLSFDARADGNTSDVADVPNRMFLTQLTTDGSFGGISFADKTCADEATAAGLSGTFVAFLSDSGTNARMRLAGSRGWVSIDGAPIGDTSESMFDAFAVFNPSNQLVDGTRIMNTSTWTGTDNRGMASVDCAGWTSATNAQMGDGNSVLNATFAGGTIGGCNVQRHLTCMEIGHVATVAPRTTPGRIMFIASASRTGSVGIGPADTLCATDATAAGLPGTYRAVLARSTATIASRFPEDSRDWVRVDGTRLAAAGEMFTRTTNYESFPNQAADGTYINLGFWTGVATTPDAPSTLADTCQDWTSNAGANMASRGIDTTASFVNLWSNQANPCSNMYRFACMQE